MKSKFKNLFSVLLLFVLLATTLCACKSAGVVPPPTTSEITSETTTLEIIHDTVFETKKDSSYYKAYLECINGKVVLRKDVKPISTPGKHLEPPKVTLQDNVLNVDCLSEANELFVQWKDVYIKEHQSDIKRVPYPVVQPLSWWQNTQIILGRIFLGIIALIALVVGLRLTKVI
jgi:hypothetical protein